MYSKKYYMKYSVLLLLVQDCLAAVGRPLLSLIWYIIFNSILNIMISLMYILEVLRAFVASAGRATPFGQPFYHHFVIVYYLLLYLYRPL